MSGKGAERSRGEKHLGEEWRQEYTEGWLSPWEPSRTSSRLRTAVEAQSSIFLHNSLRTTARSPTIEAFVACTVPDHERPTFRTRGRVFLQSEGKALFCD